MALIALGVSSSVSIYKACEIVRGFQEKKFEVQVIMTRNATRLVSPLLFSALSGRKTIVDPFAEEYSEKIAHVAMAKEVALLCVAPATANIIGKFASGVADDFLSTFYLAVECPVLIAPAMNEAMFIHHQTQQNIQKLKSLGVKFVEPEKGYLACKDTGWGRLAPPPEIIEKALQLIRKSTSLEGLTILITAGPTREYLDPVRFLTNRSSGKMGFSLAEEAIRRGAKVVLISGPTQLIPPPEAVYKPVQTAQEMEIEVMKHFPRVDVVIMAAAVSDFRFTEFSTQKVKKEEIGKALAIAPTSDILEKLSQKKGSKVIVGFAAETDDVVNRAIQKLKRKKLDLVVANDILDREIGFESDFNRVHIISPDGTMIQTEKESKLQISQIILDKVKDIVGKKKGKASRKS